MGYQESLEYVHLINVADSQDDPFEVKWYLETLDLLWNPQNF